MPDDTRLITLLPSADVDLARWLLRLWAMPYVEHPHAPVFHALALRKHGAGRTDSPLLIHRGAAYAGVDRIVAQFDATAPSDLRLVPDADLEPDLHGEVMALQHDLRWTMGMGVVHWAYFHFLQDRALVWPGFTRGVPWWETALLSLGGYAYVRRKLTDALKLDLASADAGLAAVHAGWEKVDQRLADGRAYLCGDRLTLADLAFATSGAPMVLEPLYGGHLPMAESCPEDVQAVVRDLRNRPAGQFIRRMYADLRSE
jgi:glutathione S-transferase